MRQLMAHGELVANHVLGKSGREAVDAARSTTEEEQAVAHRRWRVPPKGLGISEELAHQRGWLVRGGRAKRSALRLPRAVLGPHEHLPIIEQGDGLQAMGIELSDALGVTRGVIRGRTDVRR